VHSFMMFEVRTNLETKFEGFCGNFGKEIGFKLSEFRLEMDETFKQS
jgi:hypothetical protein